MVINFASLSLTNVFQIPKYPLQKSVDKNLFLDEIPGIEGN
jgi:hypothetical protein